MLTVEVPSSIVPVACARLDVHSSVRIFKGIPFAAPPVGAA